MNNDEPMTEKCVTKFCKIGHSEEEGERESVALLYFLVDSILWEPEETPETRRRSPTASDRD